MKISATKKSIFLAHFELKKQKNCKEKKRKCEKKKSYF